MGYIFEAKTKIVSIAKLTVAEINYANLQLPIIFEIIKVSEKYLLHKEHTAMPQILIG